jgi:multidrug resistance efflux pump
VGKWLADKNMERKLERLKAKLAEKEKELQHVQAKETSLSSLMEKERSRLTSRVHELEQQLDKMRRGVAGGMPDWASIQNAKALQARVFELEGELQRLQRQLEVLACVDVDQRLRLAMPTAGASNPPALLGSSRVMHAWA